MANPDMKQYTYTPAAKRAVRAVAREMRNEVAQWSDLASRRTGSRTVSEMEGRILKALKGGTDG